MSDSVRFITLTLCGEPAGTPRPTTVNAVHIESMNRIGDLTIITMVNQTQIQVVETPETIVARAMRYYYHE